MGNYYNVIEFCGVGVCTLVGGGSVRGDCGGVSTGGGFQRSYDVPFLKKIAGPIIFHMPPW